MDTIRIEDVSDHVIASLDPFHFLWNGLMMKKELSLHLEQRLVFYVPFDGSVALNSPFFATEWRKKHIFAEKWRERFHHHTFIHATSAAKVE